MNGKLEERMEYLCLSHAETFLLEGGAEKVLSLEKVSDYHKFHQVHNTHRTQEFTMS